MKKVFLIAAMLMGCGLVFGQKVNLHVDTAANLVYANLVPVVVPGDTLVKLSIVTFDDNQLNHCKIYYKVIGKQGEYVGNFSIDGEEYELWNDKSYLYNYVANKKGLTIAQ